MPATTVYDGGCSCFKITDYGGHTGMILMPPEGCNDSRILAFAPGDILRFTVTIAGTDTVLEQEVPDMSRTAGGHTILMPSSGFDYSVCDTFYGSACDSGITPHTYTVNPSRPSCTDKISAYLNKTTFAYGAEIYTESEMYYSIATATSTSTATATVTPTNTPQTASFQQGANLYTGCADASLLSSSPTFNNGSCTMISIGKSGTSLSRGVIKFVLTSLSGAQVQSALLTFKLNTIISGSGDVEAFRLARAFTEGNKCNAAGVNEACWTKASATSWTNPGGDYTVSMGSGSFSVGSTYLTMSLDPAVVQAWINNSAVNYGMLLKTKETADAAAPVFTQDNATQSNRPELEIIYY